MRRVLLIAPQWIGDAVMAQPLVALLAGQGARITALALPGVAPVLRAMPGVAEVVEAPFAHGRLDFKARRALAAQLRRQGFERAYVLTNNVKSRLVPWLARIPRRIGYRGEARGLLLTEALAEAPPNKQRPDMRRHYAALARPPETPAAAPTSPSGACDPPLPEPTLAAGQAEACAQRERFALPERWIALCPGAEFGPAKQWPVEHYAALARLARQLGFSVAVLGAPRDAQTGAAIATQAPGTLNLCGGTKLDDAIALLATASGVVSNDSGLMHVAAALGRPTVGVYGSTDPRHTPPAAHRSATLWLHLDCSPCFQRTCPLGHSNCLRGIAPEVVWDRLQSLFADTAAPEAG